MRALPLCFLLVACSSAVSAPQPPPKATPFKPIAVRGADLNLMPESSRQFRRLILGLEPNRTRFFMLPSTEAFDPKPTNPRVKRLRRQIYWLNYELTHGSLVTSVPSHARLFVTIPDPALVPESVGNEEEVFRDYLKTRLGWAEGRIAERVSFVKVPYHITFPRDIAEPLGVDGRSRLVLGIGAESGIEYREAVKRLGLAFPGEFVVKELPGVDTEGGDLELVTLPDGRLGLMVGHHRIRRWVQRRSPEVTGSRVTRKQIEEARSAFSKAFFGVPTHIMCEEELLNPHLVSEELFHLDMVLNIVPTASAPVAFVPSYADQPVDAITHEPLPEAVRTRVQKTYDRVANQAATMGYRVIRLPFADHPVRGPVNVAKYSDPVTGNPVVLLGRYPDHFPSENGRSPQKDLQQRFDQLDAAVERWRQTPTDASWARVETALAETWKEMDRAAAAPNPMFDAQARVYEAAGIRVLPVTLYPTGEGGLHCLGLARLQAKPKLPGLEMASLRKLFQRLKG